MDATLRRLTVGALVGSLVGVGVFACSRDKAHSTDTAALSSTSTPSSGSSGTAAPASSDSASSTAGRVSAGGSPPGSTSASAGGKAADSSASATQPSTATTTKHAARHHRRSGHVAVAPSPKPLNREGIKCVPLAGDSTRRADFSNSPAGVNPCGMGSMNLPTMAPKPTAPR